MQRLWGFTPAQRVSGFIYVLDWEFVSSFLLIGMIESLLNYKVSFLDARQPIQIDAAENYIIRINFRSPTCSIMKDSKYKIKEMYVHEEDGNMDYGASYAVRNDGHSFRGQS